MGESARTSTSSGCFIVPVQSSSSIEQLIHMPAWRLCAGDLHDVMLISASRSSRLAFAAVITRAASVVGAGNDAAAKCFGGTFGGLGSINLGKGGGRRCSMTWPEQAAQVLHSLLQQKLYDSNPLL